MKKIYSAFVASDSSLTEERNTVIGTLLDAHILPIGMEHFTAAGFSAIQDLIDDSDFFILLMGEEYGSIDKKSGLSQTHREYNYAREQNKNILVIVCEPLVRKLDSAAVDPDSLTPSQKQQVAFYNEIRNDDDRFTREVAPRLDIKTIVNQYLSTVDLSRCAGWARVDDTPYNSKKLDRWKREHRVFDIGGTWYHVHLSDTDPKYIRVGTVSIRQDFMPEAYKTGHAEGINYSVDHYDRAKKVLHLKKMEYTSHSTKYTLEDNGKVFGIVRANRVFKGEFGGEIVEPGMRRAFHDWVIDTTSMKKKTDRIDGEFRDEAPSLKHGRLFLFRKEKDRDAFLLKERGDYIEQR